MEMLSAAPIRIGSSVLLENCGYLLQELQVIWDEVGEDKFQREKVLLDLEQECFEVCRRKVDYANMARAKLHQELALAESESTRLILSLGEQSLMGKPEKTGTLKQQLEAIMPILKELRLKKQERMNQFRSIEGQIQKISAGTSGCLEYGDSTPSVPVNENDLSLKRLEELRTELPRLQKEKSDRLQRVEKYMSEIRSLSATLGIGFSMTITKIHPSLNELCGIAKNISNDTLDKLSSMVESLEEEKRKRHEKLHHLAKALTELWSIMDTTEEERKPFARVTGPLSSAAQIYDVDSLSSSIIQQTEAEVERLEQLRASKMKDLLLRKQNELEKICLESHMETPSLSEMNNTANRTVSECCVEGGIHQSNLLVTMDEQISKAREDAFSRKAIVEKVEKWMLARDEECWLEENNMDDNRYLVSRAAHRILKQAEHARNTASKIPALLDSLITMTEHWEDEQQRTFIYDKITSPIGHHATDDKSDALVITRQNPETTSPTRLRMVPLLSMLENYSLLRQEKENKKHKQQKEKKKSAQNQASVQVESPTSSRYPLNRSSNGNFGKNSSPNRRISQSIQQAGSKTSNSPIPSTYNTRTQKITGTKIAC